MIHRDYSRGEQYAAAVEWLSRGKRLPAHTAGHPDVYLLCKQNAAGEMTVGIWNFSVDPVLSMNVRLGEEYAAVVDRHACEASLSDSRTVTISSEIAGHGSAAFTVKK